MLGLIKKISNQWLFHNWHGRLLLGFIVGALFLALLLPELKLSSIKSILYKINYPGLLLVLLVYNIEILIRVIRWRYIMQPVKALSFLRVGSALTIGYAINNVVPARLGEIFRADFCKRYFCVSRAEALGTILVERIFDGYLVVLLTLIGVVSFPFHGYAKQTITTLIILSLLLFGGVGFAAFLYVLLPKKIINKFPKLNLLLYRFQHSLQILRSWRILIVLCLSIFIWVLETLCLWGLMYFMGFHFQLLQICLLIGVVSLSTLLPSPPGYLGTLQFAFVLVMSIFHFSTTQGIVAATAQQTFIFGYITLLGGVLLLLSYLSRRFHHYLRDNP